MIGESERRSAHFLEWEARGRGGRVWPHPVAPAPPFTPFLPQPVRAAEDDGRKPTLLSSAITHLSEWLAPPAHVEPEDAEDDEDQPNFLERTDIIEYQAYLPAGLRFDAGMYSALFTSLTPSAEPIAFEIVGTSERVLAQLAVDSQDASLVLSQWKAFMPEVGYVPADGYLTRMWGPLDGFPAAVVEFGLAREFMLPLRGVRADPFVGLVGALSEIGSDELGLFQVIFEPASSRWRDSVLRSVTHADGTALFVNAPELLPAAKDKTALPLFGAVIRVAARAASDDRAWQIAVNVAATLGVYGSPTGNELVPLNNGEYPPEAHIEDVIRRQCRRSGMLLNAEELAGFVHLPSGDVRSGRLRPVIAKSKAAPPSVQQAGGIRLGINEHLGVACPVFLSREARTRHMHVIGASGMGKSTLLFNLIRQDIQAGEGVSVLDPHGDLIDRILGSIPQSRIGDVVLLDPSDEEFIVPFNMLSARTDAERSLLASDLVAIFRRLSSAWGDQLGSVLHNALLAFLENERGGTLHDVRRFLIEPAFRTEFLKTVRDPDVVYYWRKAFPMLTGNKSVGPIVTRLDTFLSPKSIRYMVSHGENRVDFRDIMDSGKIFLAKLSQGAIGPENSFLLGSLIVAKLQAEAMSRQRQDESTRRYHFLYADEFHEFLTPSLAQCLSGVRKYRLGLILAHQEMQQVERNSDVASALLNAYTRLAFRVGDRDARTLESGFSSFTAADLQNLSTGQAICRVERAEWDFNVSVDTPEVPDSAEADRVRREVIAASRLAFTIPRRTIEEALRHAANDAMAEPAEPGARVKPGKVPSPTETAPVIDGKVGSPEPVPAPLPIAVSLTAELGKGGAQHEAIQARIKAEGESLGYRVVLERPVLGALGQIDVFLSRGAIEIACEISVENTIDYEVGNVSKCAKAGCGMIAVISPSEAKLTKLRAAVQNSLGQDVVAKTSYHLPDQFLSWLQKQEAPTPKEPLLKKTHGGRVVRRKVTRVSEDEAKAKELEALEMMARLMRQNISKR